MFCSPFRRRRQLRLAPESPGEVYLSREEAWTLYLAKLEEEANYFSVGEPGAEAEPDICTCHTCIVSNISQSGHNVQYPGALCWCLCSDIFISSDT